MKPRLHLQSLAASLPAAESDAAGQLPHVLDVDAPVAVEKVPLGQSLHATQPDASLNLPGVHALHPTIGGRSSVICACSVYPLHGQQPTADVVSILTVSCP